MVCFWNWLIIRKYSTGNLEEVIKNIQVYASYDLWIWYAFLGVAGMNNDINILNNSTLFDDLIDDIAYVAMFEVSGVTYKKGYYLADGIYLRRATFVKSFTVARDEKHGHFKMRQEGARKDVERVFGVL